MADLPPLPSGYTLAGGSAPPSPYLLNPLLDLGVVPTNGYRTSGDTRRLRSQGYTAANNSGHLAGDDVDLTPGKSGLSLAQLKDRADAIASQWPNGRAEIHNGTHVHLALPGWGMAPGTPGTPNSGLPPLPAGAKLQQRGSLTATAGMFAPQPTPQAELSSSTALTPVTLTGQAHDADTVRLTNGRNGRLFGFDAFELAQQGRRQDGSLVPLGQQARDFMRSRIAPGLPGFPTGAQTYDRPVINLSTDPMQDPAHDALRLGYGMAEPDYLKGSPQFGPYMEAERLARLNRLGGFQTNAETPEQFRHKNGPWRGAEPGVYGQPGSEAVFFDDPTPLQGLRPEIAKGYQAIFSDPKSKPDDMLAYAKANGFVLDPATVQKRYQQRADYWKKNPGARLDLNIEYLPPPRPLIDPGDGTFGSYARGVGDPFNALDELGGVADTLGGTRGRENLFNSDRRFGDILWNNIDQNRAILEHDQEAHPYARVAGQLTSGVALPMGAATTPLRLGAVMAAEGGMAGLMGGEGDIKSRIPNAIAGTVAGAALGPVLGLAGEHVVGPLVRKGTNLLFRRGAADAGEGAASAVASDLPPLPEGATLEAPARPQTAAMAAERGAELVGPVPPRDLPPVPDGFSLQAPFGATRTTIEPLTAEEMAKLAEGVNPEDVVPRPSNEVRTIEDATKAGPGRFMEVQAPDEISALPVRTVTAPTGGKVRVRGPLDITQSIRLMGGLKDDGGDLARLGITNEPRKMDFGSNEQFLGKLINNDTGMSADDAALRLWEEGYFPGFSERPTPADLLDRLHSESTGAQRYFHPDDLAHVEDFHRAQADRALIENAASSGAPLVEERGHSVNLDDLVANTPPTSAYEDTPRLTGKIGNINLDQLENPGQVAQLIDQVSKRVGGFDAAARGRVTHEETQRLAAEIGVTPEQLLKRRVGQALNAEQLYAARALVQRSRETVARLAKKAVGGSDEAVANFRKAWLKHAALEEQITGATAEAGRALSQFRMLAKAQDAGANAVRSYLKGVGGKESVEEAAQAIVDLMEDPAKASHFIRESVKPRWRDKFNELWINSLLSGPRTHVVNFVGNALTTLMSFPELATTAAIGKITRSRDRALFGEVTARAAGLADSSIDALRAMRTAFRTGEPLDDVAKVEAVNHEAIGGRLGRIIRTPTRALTAADEFWKSILSHGELRQIAYRTAQREGGTPGAVQARYRALTRNPTPEMLNQAHASARYWTFQKELGPVGRAVQQVSNNWVLGKLVLPFVRTPSNIIKFAGERSAFALAMPEVRAALRAGGRARDEALAKITLGSGLSTAAVVAALHGRITGGGPSDPRERAALLQSGWQPYSIKIGDRWVSYGRLDPVATLVGVAADFAEAGKWATNKEADQVALNLAMGVAKNITNKTWLSGLSDAFDVLSDPERYGKRYVQRLAGSMAVPALVAQTEQAVDPNLRDARSLMDAIKARIPVLSEGVAVRRNVWGDPISNGDAVGPDILSPFYATRMSHDPVNVEVARLRVPLSMPQRQVTVNGKRVALDPRQYDDFVQLAGQPTKAAIAQEIASPEWRRMSDEDKRDTIKGIISDMRDAARDQLRVRYPQLGGDQSPPPSNLPPLPQGFALTQHH